MVWYLYAKRPSDRRVCCDDVRRTNIVPTIIISDAPVWQDVDVNTCILLISSSMPEGRRGRRHR